MALKGDIPRNGVKKKKNGLNGGDTVGTDVRGKAVRLHAYFVAIFCKAKDF